MGSWCRNPEAVPQVVFCVLLEVLLGCGADVVQLRQGAAIIDVRSPAQFQISA